MTSSDTVEASPVHTTDPATPDFATANISTIVATVATGEQSEIDIGTGFSDITVDITSPEPGYLEPKYSNYLFPAMTRSCWNAGVEAVDINAIALIKHKLSPNVSPIIDDVEENWVFEERSLGFVRAGNLLHSIKYKPRLFNECRRKCANSLKPLARVELAGLHYVPHAEDGSVVENRLFTFKTLAKAMSTANLDLDTIAKARQELRSAGFINVRLKVLRMPIGKWMEDYELKEIGSLFEAVVKSGIPHTGMRAIEEGLD